ncbi:Crp/Fnr family transcriptional regulator [Geobacter anodireducens]|uniref:cAMP receptor protein n=3 Tax=Geobacter TaxID=28231 RepID=A0A0C1TXR9_9BACT|nr:Crp/Fnr family transcriptional regulator [Geobacter soli]ANA41619.1 Crp/Fnr family transcriptional regulator [Geobacter anodireducens]KIE44143.1 Crp/Fnr family transcriptional regulator [Geobacter soli]MBE2886777.1 Crp/Fnr family transcriptional regulator [Geobacter anodireducens]HMN03967.1 Crp/Fnr family transcriptional regulator [Geobacter anodireducens]
MAHAQEGIKHAEVERILGRLPFFSSLSGEELVSLKATLRKKSFPRNAMILCEEDSNRYMYIVMSGKVKVVRTGSDGRERIYAIHKRGDFFGEMAMLDGKTSPAAVVALEDTTVGLIAKEDFDRYLMSNSKVVERIIEMLCGRLRESWLMLKVLSSSDAEQRVRTVLGHLADMHGVNDARGTIIAMKLTHKEIAGYANLARETVSRLLTSLRKGEEIEILDSHQIVLKPDFRRDDPAAV